jgi:HlyD family secretion protein
MNEPENGSRPGLSDRVRSLRLGGAAEAAPSRTRFLPWIVAFVLLLTTTAFGFRAYSVGTMPGQNRGPAVDAGSTEKKVERSAATSTTSVSDATEVVLQSKGYVIPLSLVQVSPKVGGQLAWINPDLIEGHPFEAGDVLAVVENTDYLADFDQARAGWRAARHRRTEVQRTMPEEIEQAEADLDETRQTATQLKLDLERNRRMVAGNSATQRDFELAKYTYDATTARIRRLESSLRLLKVGRLETRIQTAIQEEAQARAVYDRARVKLEWTEVIAPVSGTILTKKAELGNIVNPSAFSSGISASLCEMADLRQLEIDMSIQERDIASIKENQLCRVMPEAYEKDKDFLAKHPQGYEGYVSRLMPTADRAKGAIPVRVRIKDIPKDESGKYLRPDMGALVSFMRGVAPK